MDQSKCGEVYRDLDGNFNYVCNCCSFEFLSAVEFEEHIILQLSLHADIGKDELYIEELPDQKQNISIEIEPVLIRHEDLDDDDIEDEEYIDADDILQDNEDTESIVEAVTLQDIIIIIINLFTCECCDKSYACRGLKQQHLHNFADDSKSCKMCPAYYEKEAELNAHIKVHNLANTLTCPHCSEVFASVSKMKRHLTSSRSEMGLPQTKRTRKRKPPAKECDELGEIIDCTDLDGIDVDKNEKKRQKFVCKYCKKEYSYLHYLKQHLKRHTDNTLNHKCNVCNHEFKLRQNLTAHMRTHTGEKPFKCRLCGKAFNQPYYMTIHMRIHQKEKPYQCTICGVSFVTSSHLGRHMKSHNNVKPHKCDQCDRAFILPGHLADHIRSQHTGERPFACDVCGSTFSRRKLLRQHKQLHGEKRFKCKYCDLAFSQSAGRRGHEIRVHNAT